MSDKSQNLQRRQEITLPRFAILSHLMNHAIHIRIKFALTNGPAAPLPPAQTANHVDLQVSPRRTLVPLAEDICVFFLELNRAAFTVIPNRVYHKSLLWTSTIFLRGAQTRGQSTTQNYQHLTQNKSWSLLFPSIFQQLTNGTNALSKNFERKFQFNSTQKTRPAVAFLSLTLWHGVQRLWQN